MQQQPKVVRIELGKAPKGSSASSVPRAAPRVRVRLRLAPRKSHSRGPISASLAPSLPKDTTGGSERSPRKTLFTVRVSPLLARGLPIRQPRQDAPTTWPLTGFSWVPKSLRAARRWKRSRAKIRQKML